METILRHPDGNVHVREISEGKRQLTVHLACPGAYIEKDECYTAYPLSLIRAILNRKGPADLCDEISRDESFAYIQRHVQYDLLGYVGEEEFEGSSILDFGCGSGASTMVLARMFPRAERIVGVELLPKELEIARMRADFYGFPGVEFHASPDGTHLPEDLGEFDFIWLSAVYEHLLPAEREQLLPELWAHLKPGGVLFLDETPYRYYFTEIHTTGLPLLNFVPARLVPPLARRFSRRPLPQKTWDEFLRSGIRGGTENEILSILEDTGASPVLLEPGRLGLHDRIDLWYNGPAEIHRPLRRRALRGFLRTVKLTTGLTLVPSLALAIRRAA